MQTRSRGRPGRRCGRGRERIVGLELDHGPYHHAHRGEGFLERVELREQCPLDAIAVL